MKHFADSIGIGKIWLVGHSSIGLLNKKAIENHSDADPDYAFHLMNLDSPDF